MISAAHLDRKEEAVQLDADSGSGDIELKDKSTRPLRKLLKLDDKTNPKEAHSIEQSLETRPPEEAKLRKNRQHSSPHHLPSNNINDNTSNNPPIHASLPPTQAPNGFLRADSTVGPSAVKHHQVATGGEPEWVKSSSVVAYHVLLVVFATMLTFFMVQFCLKKKSLIKTGKNKSSQSKKSSQIYQYPSQVSVVPHNGTASPVSPGGASRKSISASRQCAIDIEESSNDSEASSSSVDEKSRRALKSLGSLKYRLNYDFAQSLFAVTVLEAKGLPGMDLCGTSDPYVKVYFLPNDERPIQKTKVKKRNLNPVFDETFEFNISYPQLVSKTLVLAVYDYDRFSRHDPIGEISLPMNTVELAETTERWQPLERFAGSKGDEKLGDLCLGLRYVPNSGRLTVVVLEARRLKKMDVAGLSDPFVKLALYIDGKRVKKRKTEIKKCTLNPQFNESFSFEVSCEQMKTAQLRVSVIDYDRIGVSEPIGGIVLSCTDASGDTESSHWMDALASPRRQISRWHSLRPHL